MWLAWAAYWFVAASFVQRARTSERWTGRLQHRLPLVLGYLLIFHGRHPTLFPGGYGVGHGIGYLADVVTAGGLLFAVWARVHLGRYWSGTVTLKEGHRLIRTGPYALVRHPIYTGMLTGALGSAVAAGTVDALVGVAIILAAFLVKLRREETLLSGEFGDEYARFKADVPALVPAVLGGRRGGAGARPNGDGDQAGG
jgi:protein-S-isoprenylcysteine O-methyltransferase Ste14